MSEIISFSILLFSKKSNLLKPDGEFTFNCFIRGKETRHTGGKTLEMVSDDETLRFFQRIRFNTLYAS